MSRLRIGIDFDNTIAGYDRVFRTLAAESGLIGIDGTETKTDVRDAVRRLDDGDTKWQQMQGQAYGARMQSAELVDGVDRFLAACARNDAEVLIISHKTAYGHFDPERVNLRDAARRWMTDKGFFDGNGYGLKPENVIFEETRTGKVERIAAAGCDLFIDDLPEVFLEPNFPAATRRYLLAPDGAPDGPYKAMPSWLNIKDDVFAA